MDILKLKHFKAIYETKSITRAGDQLGISKTALSLSLKTLEEVLGCQLFVRSNKSMLPNAEADELYSRSCVIISLFDQLVLDFKDLNKRYTGTIRIGAPLCFGQEMLLPFLPEYKMRHPDVQFALRFNDGDTLKRLSSEGQLDFAIVGDDIVEQLPGYLIHEKVYDYNLVLCCSSSYYDRVLKKKTLSKENISYCDFVNLKHLPTNETLEKYFDQKLGESSFIVDNHNAHLQLLLDGHGIGFQAEYSVQKHLESGALVNLKIPFKKTKYSFYCVQLSNKVPTAFVKGFISEFKKHLS
jgi:DNA-binding transcriptional LysR family regulator